MQLENRILGALPRADISAIRPYLTRVVVERGTILIEPRQTIDHVYFPQSGLISLLSITSGGDGVETGIVGQEGLVGANVAFGSGQMNNRANMQIEGMVLRMGSADFIRAYNASDKLRALVDEYQAFLLTQAQQAAACHSLHTVNARLCRWLLHAGDMLKSDDVPLTQEYLSHMLGVHRSSVSLEAHGLQQAGLIKYSRGNVVIKNRTGLEECSCECYRVIRKEYERLELTSPSGPIADPS